MMIINQSCCKSKYKINSDVYKLIYNCGKIEKLIKTLKYDLKNTFKK